jgi:endonuclease-8
MPEGDTVYRVARELHAALAGSTLIASDFRVPSAATIDLAGEPVTEVLSRGKHILMHIGAYTVHSHLRMEGRWRVVQTGDRLPGPAFQIRAVLSAPERTAVGLELGLLDVVPTTREHELVGHLGPDLLGTDWDAAQAVARLSTDPNVPVSVALLDQRNLAGIGNEFANELCFVRGLDPATPIGEVADLPALVSLAARMLHANRDRSIRSTTGDLRPGRTSWVFGREGRPCRRCGARIVKSRLGPNPTTQRDAYRCPHCQP